MSSRTDDLQYLVRDAPDPEGILVLLHGRGASEHDLFPLLDFLDPERRFLGVTPRAPLSLPPGGFHWYAFGGIGTPEPRTFAHGFGLLSGWLDALVAEAGLGYGRLVLGGFSQGGIMSYAAGLAAGRPRPAKLLAMSSFVPRVAGLELDLPSAPPTAIGHGTRDDVIGVEWGREARTLLEAAGADVLYREYPLPHAVDPAFLEELRPWLREVVERGE